LLVPRLIVSADRWFYLSGIADIPNRAARIFRVGQGHWLAILELRPGQPAMYSAVGIEKQLAGCAVNLQHVAAVRRE
jgi:hypothetical protein